MSDDNVHPVQTMQLLTALTMPEKSGLRIYPPGDQRSALYNGKTNLADQYRELSRPRTLLKNNYKPAVGQQSIDRRFDTGGDRPWFYPDIVGYGSTKDKNIDDEII